MRGTTEDKTVYRAWGVKGQKEAEGSSENENSPTAGGRGIKEMHKY